MEKEKIPTIYYQYMALKKSRVLGLRVNHIKMVLLGTFLLFAVLGTVKTIVLILLWVVVGSYLDRKQRAMTRSYIQSVIAWNKTKSIEIKDSPKGVLSIFRK